MLIGAEAFEFTSLTGERLELWGQSLSWSDTIDTGVVQRPVLKRAGALHQKVGSGPLAHEFRCAISGSDCTARYRRVQTVVQAEPEGLFVHPRLGSFRAVCKGLQSSETPGEAQNLIEYSIKFEETGIHDPPQPSAEAAAQTAQSQAISLQTVAALEPAEVQQAAQTVLARASGLLTAVNLAQRGLSDLPTVDASLAALVTSVELLSQQAGKDTRRAAALALSEALAARNRLAAGRPALIEYRCTSVISLGALSQQMYGSQGRALQAELLRLNRLERPFALPAGTLLLLPDPAAFGP